MNKQVTDAQRASLRPVLKDAAFQRGGSSLMLNSFRMLGATI
ncbi:MAG TPA: hypothetical protein VKH40_05670 [Alloacidobacterium sp.]|nr:hypothetical protein [Alloacidobacterium sp.]